MRGGPPPSSRKVGDIQVTTVSDGILNATLNNFVGVTPAEAERMSGLPADGPVPLAVNAFLLTFNGKRALIDAGSSSTMGPTLGKLPDNLRAIGVAPEAIDFVLLTHIHPDHSNGLVDEAGGANFPNADVIVNREDLRFWVEREPQASDNEFRQRNMAAARRAFAPYRERVRAVSGGEVLPGITGHPQPGHTPGHTGWLIASGGDALLVWGDIVHVTGVQFARPDAALTFDLDPEAARRSRTRVFDWVASDRIRVAGAHLDLPGFGHVARSGSGYRFEAEV
ncbi:MAG: MBL fold metallo-hydrolase [Xanthobacteraceae bacterium]|jgi:glyoxylase-like metal-dependent hydrolase (beta-lactamase superfamily II)